MNASLRSTAKQNFDEGCREVFRQLAQTAASYDELLAMWQEFHNAYLELAATELQRWAETFGLPGGAQADLEKIEADAITVEVSDRDSGRLFRRNLPIKYVETANGAMLSGETLEGRPSQLALLSDFACGKIDDVTGRGADSPRDHDH